jgi:hypothetical protein
MTLHVTHHTTSTIIQHKPVDQQPTLRTTSQRPVTANTTTTMITTTTITTTTATITHINIQGLENGPKRHVARRLGP